MADRPYKFLDFYGPGDAAIFAGRDREIDILLADILATRLVVLYAKTGCGKSSLINAGVRPRLQELEYPSVLIRVERDPTRSAFAAFREAGYGPADTNERFSRMVVRMAEAADSPIVVFFDQFEEFFVYQSSERQRAFIAEIAELYNSREPAVHLVLSMREEFFYQLDSFRDYIPRIFHKESNLRLRWLETAEAREAIVKPAAQFGVEIEKDVEDGILEALAEDGYVEPARLQIVCDTLWEKRANGHIGADLYRALGGARGILARRLIDDFDQQLSAAQLPLLERAIPELSSTEGTKKIRAVDELAPGTHDAMSAVVEKLIALRLLRASTRDRVRYVEWTSDYLAEHAEEIAAAVHRLWLKRLVERCARGGSLNPDELLEVAHGLDSLGPVPPDAAGRLLAQALEHGVEIERFRALAGAGALLVLRHAALTPGVPVEAAEHAIRTLAGLGGADAFDVLREALKREDLAFEVISILYRSAQDPEAMGVLRSGLDNPRLAPMITALPGMRQAASPSGSNLAAARSGAPAAIASTATAAGSGPVVDARDRLASGSIVVALGPGVSVPQYPSESAVAVLLASRFQCPPGCDLPAAAEFCETLFGRTEPFEFLREVYLPDSGPSVFHDYLAGLPGQPVFVSLAFDEMLESAFARRGRDLQVITWAGQGRWRRTPGRDTELFSADDLAVSDTMPVLYRIRGSFHYPADALVMTEEDHIRLTSARLPTELRYGLARSGCMLVGMEARDWHSRLLLNLLFGQNDPRRRRNYVVAPEFTEFEAKFWNRRYTLTVAASPETLIRQESVSA